MVLDVFLGRTKYDSFLGKEFIHLRAWQPMNIRAFIAAIEYDYKVPDYIMASNDPCLKGVLNGIVEAYAGERGFMGTHRCKYLTTNISNGQLTAKSRQNLWIPGDRGKKRQIRYKR